MNVLRLKQFLLSPPTPTKWLRDAEGVNVSYGVTGFEIRGATEPRGDEYVEVTFAVTGFQLAHAIPPATSESITVAFGASEFIFKSHPYTDSGEAVSVAFGVTGLVFQSHPYTDSGEVLNVSFGAVGFEYAGSASDLPWHPMLMQASPFVICDDKSTVTTDGPNVITWHDRTNNGYHFEQSTAGHRPTLVENVLASKRALRFEDTDRLVSTDAVNFLNGQSSGWMFVVVKKDALDGAATHRAVAIVETPTTGQTRFGLFNGTGTSTTDAFAIRARRLDTDTEDELSDDTAASTDWVMVLATINYGTRKCQLFVNGESSEIDTEFLSSGGETSATLSAAISIGAASDGQFPWHGDIACVLMGRMVPNLSEVDKLFGYYAHRFGLQRLLDTAHPYKLLVPYPVITTTKLLFEGADNSTVFTDSSNRPKTWTRGGTAAISTAQFYGGSSSYYNTSGNTGYLTTPYHKDFDLSSEDFCIRVNARPTGTAWNSLYGTLLSKRQSGGDFDWVLFQNQNNRSICFSYGDDSAARRDLSASANTFPVDDWTHAAVTKYRNQLDLWIDGVSVATHTVVGKIRNRNLSVDIGKSMSWGDSYWAGWLDSIEIIKGDAAYFETFTVPPNSKEHIQNIDDVLTIGGVFMSASVRQIDWEDMDQTYEELTLSGMFESASTRIGLVTHTQEAEDSLHLSSLFFNAGTSTP